MSSCVNDYFRTYAIIYFLANLSVFPNRVTFILLIYLCQKVHHIKYKIFAAIKNNCNAHLKSIRSSAIPKIISTDLVYTSTKFYALLQITLFKAFLPSIYVSVFIEAILVAMPHG